MLARNYKTNEELGLVPGSVETLSKVLTMLETGKLIHTPRYKLIPFGFNMGPMWDERDCGTVGCIAGWAHKLGEFKLTRQAAQGQQMAISNLVAPRHKIRNEITTDEAAHALRTYLVTGQPEWR